MSYVFVDNYRGFTNALIPIKDVNFLVGENSTGKTSILGLLKLLSSAEFWLSNELDVRKVGFGTFKDVVSINSSDKSFFTIGLSFDAASPKVSAGKSANTKRDKKNEEKRFLFCIALTFIEKEGMPKLASILSYRKGIEAHIKYVGSKIRYKSRVIDFGCNANEFAATKFVDWVKASRKDTSGFKILKEPTIWMRNAPPVFLLSTIEAMQENTKEVSPPRSLEMPTFFHDIAWLAPIRSKPRKTYDEFSLEFSPEGDHIPYLIKKKLDSKIESIKFKEFLSEVGKKSGLFREIEIKSYGRGATSPFELDIILNELPLSVSSVGYGVSQALPVIVEIFSRPKESWFAIQQPEVHLHPKAQAAFGEIFFNLAVIENKKFIIETHSDYAIDRYRLSLRKHKNKPDSQILFFERTNIGNKVMSIKINEDGELASQPESYRSFFVKEEMDLLGL